MMETNEEELSFESQRSRKSDGSVEIEPKPLLKTRKVKPKKDLELNAADLNLRDKDKK